MFTTHTSKILYETDIPEKQEQHNSRYPKKSKKLEPEYKDNFMSFPSATSHLKSLL